MDEGHKPLCSCHSEPMQWSAGSKGGHWRCKVRHLEGQRRRRQESGRKTEWRYDYHRALKRAAYRQHLEAIQRKTRQVQYAAARELCLAVRGVDVSGKPIRRGALPPLCACHHEPMLNNGEGGWRCGVERRAAERAREALRKEQDYEKWREKGRRKERRRRAHKRGAVSEPYTREALLQRDGGRCRYCGEAVSSTWQVAHLVALSRGGHDTWDNVAVSCAACNRADGVHRLPVQLHLPLQAA